MPGKVKVRQDSIAAEVAALARTLVTPEVLYFPVRHHSPACAWQLRRWIRENRPRAVLIEGPEDYRSLLPHLVDERCVPPVAIYSYFRVGGKSTGAEDERHASYYPLCDYSPEWVALREGHAVGADLRFIDLDYATQRHLESTAREDPGALRVESLQAEHYFQRSRLLQAMAERCGCRDHDELWDHLVEVHGWRKPLEQFVHEVAAYCWVSRKDAPPEMLEADGTLAREKVMASAIRKAIKQRGRSNGGPVLVVTGGFHSVVLPDFVAASPARVQRFRPTEKHASLTRYTFAQLDSLTGYGAGMPQPGFYQLYWEALTREEAEPLESVALHLLVELGRRARTRGMSASVSVADEIAALEQARRLGQLRGHSGPSREDLWDAVRGCLIKGEQGVDGEALLALARKLFTGNATGDVPPDAGVPPLVDDFRRRAKEAKLPVAFGGSRSIKLEIYKKPAHRRVSRLLHQLSFLDVPYGQRGAGPDFLQGTDLRRIIEHWDCHWEPATESTLIERAAYGSSVHEAAAARLREVAAQLEASGSYSARSGVSLLVRACLMGLPDAAEDMTIHLKTWVGLDASFASVAEALSQMMLLWQSREPLEARKLTLLPELTETAYQRACQLLDDAANVPDDKAAPVLDGCLLLRSRLATQNEEDHALDPSLLWMALESIVEDPRSSPLLRGGGAGLLHTAGILELDALISLTAGALSPAVGESARQVDFLTGLLRAARELAWREPRLLESVEHLFESWSEDEFLLRLPHLRLAWSDLTPREADRVAALVADKHGSKSVRAPRHAGVSEGDLMHALQVFSSVEKALAEDGLDDWLKPESPSIT